MRALKAHHHFLSHSSFQGMLGVAETYIEKVMPRKEDQSSSSCTNNLIQKGFKLGQLPSGSQLGWILPISE